MTDIVLTAANVLPTAASAVTVLGLAGATITQGKVLYLDATSGKWKLADSNDASAAVHKASGIALTGGSDGQPIVVQTAGDITIGGTLVPGSRYYVSGTP